MITKQRAAFFLALMMTAGCASDMATSSVEREESVEGSRAQLTAAPEASADYDRRQIMEEASDEQPSAEPAAKSETIAMRDSLSKEKKRVGRHRADGSDARCPR